MKVKKPKKKDFVELEKQIKYYHKLYSLRDRYIEGIVTRKEAEKRGYRMCTSGCF